MSKQHITATIAALSSLLTRNIDMIPLTFSTNQKNGKCLRISNKQIYIFSKPKV